jgi:uncharacterized protein
MHTNLLTHAIEREFPELAATVARLKASDPHFKQMLLQHDALDVQITKDEMGVARVSDVALEDMKKQRLHLKDALYQQASAASAR